MKMEKSTVAHILLRIELDTADEETYPNLLPLCIEEIVSHSLLKKPVIFGPAILDWTADTTIALVQAYRLQSSQDIFARGGLVA